MSQKIIDQINKRFGKGSIRKLGDESVVDIDVISTQCNTLDKALGVGGIPRGRITELFGPASSGKTTLTLHLIAETQQEGNVAAFIDAENAFDPKYAENVGVDIDELLFSQPNSAEEALEMVELLVGHVSLIVVDSVAALVPKAELEGEMGQSHVGLQARLMSQAMRKLSGKVKKTNTALIFINQIREKVGVMYGSPETTSGGRALPFYSSIRLDIRRIGAVKNGDEIIGNKTRVRVKKNKVASPFRAAEFEIIYGKGINRELERLEFLVRKGVVEKAGSWYRYNGEPVAQGTMAMYDWVRQNEELLNDNS